MSEQPFYQSSNGDRWYLSEDPTTGSEAIKHVGNPESGGQFTYVDIESFLASGNGSRTPSLSAAPKAGTNDHGAHCLRCSSGERLDCQVNKSTRGAKGSPSNVHWA
jgi:hypothetical protein